MLSKNDLLAGKVALILGGWSQEREVSLNTGTAIFGALKKRGYSVIQMDPGIESLPERLAAEKPVAAFVALHGRWGEDGCVQGLLEWMQIPYTGSGVMASAVAMDKALTKKILSGSGMDTPEYIVTEPGEGVDLYKAAVDFGFPLVVKPVQEGSSVGVSIVRREGDLRKALDFLKNTRGTVMFERFVPGREFSVAVMDEPLGAIEIVPARPFYDYDAKYAEGSGTKYIFPPPISEKLHERLNSMAFEAYRLLGCEGVCRADFILDPVEKPWFIEINTLPGMTEKSLVPKIAAGRGMDFEELCERLLLGARLKS